MSDVEAALPAFVIPLQKSTIMLPNASVAAIIPSQPLKRVHDTPDWCIGVLAWRGVQVPASCVF